MGVSNWRFFNDIHKARSCSAKLKCFGCGRPGTTLGYHKGNCEKNYHYICAKACGVVFLENSRLYCRDHCAFAKDTLSDFSEPMKPLKISAPKDV
jgi:hypothetical protein